MMEMVLEAVTASMKAQEASKRARSDDTRMALKGVSMWLHLRAFHA